MAQRQADVVESFNQAELAEGSTSNARLESTAVGDSLLFKRDGQLIVRNGLRVFSNWATSPR